MTRACIVCIQNHFKLSAHSACEMSFFVYVAGHVSFLPVLQHLQVFIEGLARFYKTELPYLQNLQSNVGVQWKRE